MNFFKLMAAALCSVFGTVTTAEFIKLAVETLVTPDVIQAIEEATIVVADRSLSGADKKEEVINRLMKMKGLLRDNVEKAGQQAISRAIDLVVNRLKLLGKIK